MHARTMTASCSWRTMGAFCSMVVTAAETGPHAFGPFYCVPHHTSRKKDPVACWGNSPASTPTGQCQAAAEKTTQAQPGIIVTVSEPEACRGSPIAAHGAGFLQVISAK
jgi:hypothetical protein